MLNKYDDYLFAFTKQICLDIDNKLATPSLLWQIVGNAETLELAKLLTDTTYYGVLISYAQKTKVICDKYGVDYDEMWQFADEAHAKIGNRPKMFPGYIGGHCVIPNLYLLDPEAYDNFKYIIEHNDFYKKWMEEKAND